MLLAAPSYNILSLVYLCMALRYVTHSYTHFTSHANHQCYNNAVHTEEQQTLSFIFTGGNLLSCLLHVDSDLKTYNIKR